MKKRCGSGFKLLGTAVLEDHEFFVNYSGWASIRVCEGSRVYGLLFEIGEKCLASLDRYEGYPSIYNRFQEKTKSGDAEFDAWVYVDPTPREGRPKGGYLEKIMRAALANNFPEEYIKYLQSWKR